MSENQATGIGEKISSLLFLIGPFVLLWGFFWLVPLIGSFEESLSLSPQLVGKIASEEQFTLMNYGRALNDGKFIKSLENTLIFVTSTVAITLSIGFFPGMCFVWDTQTTKRVFFVPIIDSFSCFARNSCQLILSLFSWQIRCSQSISDYSART